MIFIKKIGNQSYILSNPITIQSTASIVGPKEKDGPLHQFFDQCLEDEFWGENSWEKAESKIVKETVNMAISKSGIAVSDIIENLLKEYDVTRKKCCTEVLDFLKQMEDCKFIELV